MSDYLIVNVRLDIKYHVVIGWMATAKIRKYKVLLRLYSTITTGWPTPGTVAIEFSCHLIENN